MINILTSIYLSFFYTISSWGILSFLTLCTLSCFVRLGGGWLGAGGWSPHQRPHCRIARVRTTQNYSHPTDCRTWNIETGFNSGCFRKLGGVRLGVTQGGWKYPPPGILPYGGGGESWQTPKQEINISVKKMTKNILRLRPDPTVAGGTPPPDRLKKGLVQFFCGSSSRTNGVLSLLEDS